MKPIIAMLANFHSMDSLHSATFSPTMELYAFHSITFLFYYLFKTKCFRYTIASSRNILLTDWLFHWRISKRSLPSKATAKPSRIVTWWRRLSWENSYEIHVKVEWPVKTMVKDFSLPKSLWVIYFHITTNSSILNKKLSIKTWISRCLIIGSLPLTTREGFSTSYFLNEYKKLIWFLKVLNWRPVEESL